MVIIYGSFRPVTPNNIFTVTATSGGQITGNDTLYLWAAFRNRVGWNSPTDPKTVNYTSGQRILLSIDNQILIYEEVFEITILGSHSNDLSSAKQLTSVKIRGIDQVSIVSLPIDIYLSKNEHINLNQTVADLESLPLSSDRINGQVREVASEGKILEFDSYLSDWKERSQLSSVVLDPRFGVGSDRPVELIDNRDILIPPVKNLNQESTPLIFWWLNGYSADGGADLDTDSKASIAVWVNGESDKSYLFADRIKVRLLGYIDRASGVLDTNIPNYLQQFRWHPNQPLNLAKPLPRGSAAIWEIILSFDNDEMPIASGSRVTISLLPLGNAGVRSELWALLGDCVLNYGEKLLITNDRRLPGKGLVKGYAIDTNNDFYLNNILPDRIQYAAISGVRNGEIIIRASLDRLLESESLRAVISTVGGEQQRTTLTSPVAIAAGQYLRINITAPTKIKNSYPEIGGKNATLNAPQYNVYLVKNTNEFYKKNTPVNALPTGLLSIDVTNIADFTAISALPTNNNSEFGLFDYGSISVTGVSGGSLDSGSYQVAIAYLYPSSGNHAITKISHLVSDGCLSELDLLSRIPATRMTSYKARVVSNSEILGGIYTLKAEDLGYELIFTGTVSVKIPDNSVDFFPYWHCLIALDGVGVITFSAQNSATLIPSRGNDYLSLVDQGSIAVRHRGNNIWKLEGALSQ